MSHDIGHCHRLDIIPDILVPIVHNLEQDGTAEFFFVQGTHQITVPRGYEEYFGPPPHYSYCADLLTEDMERSEVSQDSVEFGDTPEETMRNVQRSGKVDVYKQDCMQDMDRLNKLLDSEGPFDAVLGFSLGACIGATLLEDNIRKSQEKGVPSMFKMGIFLCGCPPWDPREPGMLLADTAGKVFELPTIHVVGSTDPVIDYALALYNLCDPDTAEIFDHGKGHQLIW